MNKDDLVRFANEIALTSLNYDVEISKEKIDFFHSELSRYPIERIENAFRQHRRESNKFPTLADILWKIKNPDFNGGHRKLRLI